MGIPALWWPKPCHSSVNKLKIRSSPSSRGFSAPALFGLDERLRLAKIFSIICNCKTIWFKNLPNLWRSFSASYLLLSKPRLSNPRIVFGKWLFYMEKNGLFGNESCKTLVFLCRIKSSPFYRWKYGTKQMIELTSSPP